MKKLTKIYLTGFISLVFFLFIGCITTPVEYSFASAEQGSSAIGFLGTRSEGTPGVAFVSFDGRRLPRAEKKTHWEPLLFPSDRELNMVVHVKYEERERTKTENLGLLGTIIDTAQSVRAVTRNVDTNIDFNCPPLESGKRYQLTYSKGAGIPGRNALVLIDTTTGQIVHQQEFVVILGGLSVW